MKKKEQEEKVLEFYLSAVSSQVAEGEHLDDDILAALLEGNISQRQSEFLVKHLASCGFCRHLTAELIKFDSTLMETEEESYRSEPSKISDKVRNLLTELFQLHPAAIEAFEDKAERKDEKEDKSKDVC